MATLFLVDIENICKNPISSVTEIQIARKLILHITNSNPDQDFFVIGTHVGLKVTVDKAWPKKNSFGAVNRAAGFFELGKDQDQAGDRILTSWMKSNEAKLKKWDSVVIASGDSHFVDVARNLITRGKRVTVLALAPSNMSRELRKIKKAQIKYITDLSPIFSRGFRGLSSDKVDSWISSRAFPVIKKSKIQKIKETVSKPVRRTAKSLNWKPELGAKALIKTTKGELIVRIWNNDKVWLSDGYLFVGGNSKIVEAILESKIGDHIECVMEGKKYEGVLTQVVSNRAILGMTRRRLG
jgi:hypothetical protein